MKLYETLAQNIAERIEQGYFQPGDKLPSIRQMSAEHDVSISTAQEAYRLLEERYLAAARPKSGYYVLASNSSPTLPDISRPSQKPLLVSRWEQVVELLHSHEKNGMLALGKGVPDVSSNSLKPLLKITATISRRADIAQLTYDSLEGPEVLRHQIARLMVDSGCRLHPDDILITTGCQEALACSMRAIAKPGDIIASDSPGFYGAMQTIQAMGLKALEIPTHPETGISLEALELALEQWPIKILQLNPACNNPLGYTMPDAHKVRLMALAKQYDLLIIEDDIYGDLAYSYPRPRSLKSYDTEGRVLFCSSFSKTLSPAFRTGWCAPGRYLQQVKHMKYVSTACSSTLQPRAIAEFIAQGHYERHLRKMRGQYVQGRDRMIEWVQRYFPEGTRMSHPQGSFLLWVELPKALDSNDLNRALLSEKVSIAPGILFTAANKYRNCLRLNYAQRADDKIHQAVKTIGETAKKLLRQTARD
ncbi:MAG: PLP-dependent aminotransferase family protein [Cellvibrionaceae bacterium]|nr:PLP-dependent aminotransferase family protein [Cellvibrionaceae bacterium]